jgi:hypothetical protein
MGHAVVLNTASKASTTGGTFADTLTANNLDSLAVQNFETGGAKITGMWGIDSASVAEVALTSNRPEATHDPQFGIRFNIAPNVGGSAGSPAAVPMLIAPNEIPAFPGDTWTFTATSTAADALVVSWLTEYDNLPGVTANFASWDRVQALRTSTIGVRVIPVASGTKGAYGTARAANADDTRWTGSRWYALLGFTVQIPVCTVSFRYSGWGNQRFGCSAGMPFLSTDNFFLDQATRLGEPLIPCFSGFDVGNVLLEVADDGTSTSPKVDMLCVECSDNPAIGGY